MTDTSKSNTHICRQEGIISELKARTNIMSSSVDKIESKMTDILEALHKSNESSTVKSVELYTSFKNIESMLVAEKTARKELVSGQQRIHDNINTISTRVNKIESDISNIKEDLTETKRVIKGDKEHLNKRISSLERVSHYVYAVGAIIVTITFIVIYGAQLYSIAKPNNAESKPNVVGAE